MSTPLSTNAWNKRYVPVERVQPLVLFLERAYGSLVHASEVTGVATGTLSSIKARHKNGVKKDIALQIVEAVKVLRHGDRRWSTYENEVPPHFATSAEQDAPQSFSRWRPAGGKVKR